MPYWYSTDGQKEIILSKDGSNKNIHNSEKFDAPPIFIYQNPNTQNASVTLKINGIKTIISPLTAYVEQRLDGLNMQYKGIKANGDEIFISPLLPSNLTPGENTVSVTALPNSNEICKIIPNWRRL